MDRVIRLYVPLRREEYAQLTAVAQAQRRLPAQQAAVMLLAALHEEAPHPATPVAVEGTASA